MKTKLMTQKFKHLPPLILISLVGLFFMRALFHPGFYTSHDGWHQVARLYHFTQALHDGQFPPRWNSELLQGVGYPLFIFSYHLPWWIGAPMVFLGNSIFTSIKFVFIFTYILSGFTMYAFLSRLWGKKAALAGALVYMVTPYRFATILVRANIGEAVGFVFLPLIFLGMTLLRDKRPYLGYVIGAIAISGAVLSHVMVLFLALPALCLYFLIQIGDATKQRLTYLKRSIAMVCLGLGVSAYYLLPAIYYRPLAMFSDLYSGLYQNHFTTLTDLLYSPWGYSPIGIGGEMSRQVGLVIWGVWSISLLMLLYRFARKKFDRSDKIGLLGIIILLGAVYMMTKHSVVLWKQIEHFTFIDFPWRFLSITTFVGSLLTAFFVVRLKKISTVVIILLLIGIWYTNRNHIRVNQYTDIPLSLYVASERTTNTDDEYLPKWVSRTEASRENIPRITATGAKIDNLIQESAHISFSYSLDQPEQVIIRQIDFPGMSLFVDGKARVFQRGGDGFITFEAPAGTHQVALRYLQTALMRWGNLITVVSMMLLVVCIVKAKKSVIRT